MSDQKRLLVHALKVFMLLWTALWKACLILLCVGVLRIHPVDWSGPSRRCGERVGARRPQARQVIRAREQC